MKFLNVGEGENDMNNSVLQGYQPFSISQAEWRVPGGLS